VPDILVARSPEGSWPSATMWRSPIRAIRGLIESLAAEWGATAAWASEAAHGADVVVVTIPEKDVANLPDNFLKGAADDVVVIDTGNYYKERDGRIEEIEAGMTDSRWVEEQIGVSVVKAFNNIEARAPPRVRQASGDHRADRPACCRG
jgi:predicted dinucleotide-binding enzyme